MPLFFTSQDITKMDVDAIVNAANTGLLMGGGVCGAIFKAAGAGKLQLACRELAPIETGDAVITPGFALHCKYIIHAAGPIYEQFSPQRSEELLYSAYAKSLQIAVDNGCSSIVFPLISSGIYGYPKQEALQVAISAICDFLLNNDIEVYLSIFARKAVMPDCINDIDDYLDRYYEIPKERVAKKASSVAMPLCEKAVEQLDTSAHEIESVLSKLDVPFSEILLRMIDEKGMSDVEVYKRANIDRKLFSKIRTVKDYIPSKRTVLALAFAMRLSYNETIDLLACAGYALSHSKRFDVIIEYYLLNGEHDIFEVNKTLFFYDEALLGS